MTLIQTAIQNGRMSPLIRVDTAWREGVRTIRLSGELDCASQAATRCALNDSLAGHVPPRLIIDLAQLEFCDCAGARVLNDVRRAAEELEIKCVFKNPQPQVSWVLQAAGIASLLVIRTDGSDDPSLPHSQSS